MFYNSYKNKIQKTILLLINPVMEKSKVRTNNTDDGDNCN